MGLRLSSPSGQHAAGSPSVGWIVPKKHTHKPNLNHSLICLPIGGASMKTCAWIIPNVDDLTRRSFEVLAERTGLDRAEFLQLLIVEYARAKVLHPKPRPGEGVPEKLSGKPASKAIQLKPVEGEEEADAPTGDEIADWMRRLDAKKEDNARKRRTRGFGLGLLQA